METVNLGTEEDKKKVKIGANLEPSIKQRLIQMLRDYVEIFAWSYEDMPGLVLYPKIFPLTLSRFPLTRLFELHTGLGFCFAQDISLH